MALITTLLKKCARGGSKRARSQLGLSGLAAQQRSGLQAMPPRLLSMPLSSLPSFAPRFGTEGQQPRLFFSTSPSVLAQAKPEKDEVTHETIKEAKAHMAKLKRRRRLLRGMRTNVGRQPITVPEGVTIDVDEAKHTVTVKGAKGELSMPYFENLSLDLNEEGSKITVNVIEDRVITDKGRSSGVGRLERTRLGPKNTKMMWGTTRALLYNMVRGVSLGYRVE